MSLPSFGPQMKPTQTAWSNLGLINMLSAGWKAGKATCVLSSTPCPTNSRCVDFAPPIPFGEAIQLVAQCQPAFPQRIPAGQVAILGLRWQTQQRLTKRYTVTVQLLDARNQVIAQHDAQPAGGSRPTDGWESQHAHHGQPRLAHSFWRAPGIYRLIVALYDESGLRLSTPTGDATGDAYELGEIEVVRPERALPLEVIDMRHRLNAQLGPVTLVGYDAHKKDHSYAPETPVQAGDLVHFTLYWQAPDPLPAESPAQWPADLGFTLTLGGQSLSAPLAGGAYPTAAWQPGELLRGEFDVIYDGNSNIPTIEVNGSRLNLKSLPH